MATWSAALTRRSHNYILPISVAAVSPSWDAGKAAKVWTFNLPQASFDQQCYIRVRGIAGWILGGDDGALWTLDVKLPDKSVFIYENGTTQTLSQGQIKCRLSAVTSRVKQPNATVLGLASCYNASPIGDGWEVRIQDAFNLGSPKTPDDIQLDLYLSVLPL